MLNIAKLRSVLVYDAEQGIFTWAVSRGPVASGEIAGTTKADGYRAIQLDGREWHEHRLAWAYVYGELPLGGLQIDHINRVRSDNRIANLRLATRAQQQANSKLSRNNRHGCKGIKFRTDRQKWRAEIYVCGKPIHLGQFATKEEAISAYEAGAAKYYGEFAAAGSAD